MRIAEGTAPDDEEWDDDSDEDDDPTMPCPHCGCQIYDDSEHCPRCGHYLSYEDRPFQRRPWWFVAGVIACFAIFYTWIFGIH